MPEVTVGSPILDLRECLPSTHPEEFFELMDGLKPYVVLQVDEDEVMIKLMGAYYSTEDFRERAVKLANLGYATNPALELKTAWSGAYQYLDFEPMTIRWNKDRVRGA